ncbi:DinB family protein [Tenacibaculum sp. ZS6-P6]|uniref:DinB family protein n=1 Tax=Tenacibaculum sp. ZS6-P6 TaxID=3447503 RepID=UPI003F9C2668
METKVNQLKEQILLVNKKTNELIENISKDRWNITPDIINTNLNWQLGHIILANYLHGVASIIGANDEFKEKVSLPNYIKFYGPGSKPSNYDSDKPTVEELIQVYKFTMDIIIEIIENITIEDLDSETAVPNPSVNMKYEALMWLPQHQSWHNGQIAILKRVLNL